ncbi:hypothetical protein LCGC14_1439070 [marine sediment metagenome]|uniref:Uncharacterized protein n=1 Tax=marine sediment metagenome TaxID=412755 RepID=A0A0F9M1R8_9ZZZZ
MSRMNFREIRDRFTHIDAKFVSCELGFGDVVPRYTVRFYPWWEHPTVVEALRTGKPWGLTDECEVDVRDVRDVTVYPLGLAACKLSLCEEVVDWAFLESHPYLWPYEDSEQIFCNSDPPLDELFERIQARLQDVPRAELYSYLDPLLPYKAPFCLGTFAFTLFNVVHGELEEMGVAVFVSRRPEPRPTPVLLLIDGDDYIIADDFELDVPHFQHNPEWFKPS